ncbi:MAG: hypothetical protein SGI77_25765 [Pirellulaceae bacterium]|nr:hypothetical protein [Pirellulaceae bacterium]
MRTQIDIGLTRPTCLRCAVLFGIAAFVASYSTAFSEEKHLATHKQAYTIKPTMADRDVKLETFCVGPRGSLWMACRVQSKDGSPDKGLIMVYDPSGLLFDSFPLNFVPQAINFAPNSKMYVAGSGKVARVALGGIVEVEIDAPNIGNREEAIAKARKKAEEEAADVREEFEVQKKQIIDRLNNITAIAATDNEVFVACPEPVGDSYGVWRLSPDLTVEAKIIQDAHGCCGQFDIQSDGEKLILAENTKFEVGIYDRNGKRLSGFGKRAGDDQEGFGSSCNPMNVCCRADGEILTAESSIGHIKRFKSDGTFVGFVGTAKVAGECKRVAIGFDPDRNWYYMMNEDLSHVAVLVLKEEAPEENEDELQAR